MRALYRALLPEGVRARVRPLLYPSDTLFRAVAWRAAGGRVYAGPFAGLRLAPRPYLPHLLGTYEQELHPALERLCAHAWRRIVNVGGGNGYYIAGFGRRVPESELVVFELDSAARDVISATLARNGLAARARVLGTAEPEGLEAACAGEGRLLVVMDVEGAEVELTDLAAVPSLRRATVLVETHDFARAGCTAAIAERFERSHRITVIPTTARTLADFPRALSGSLVRWSPARCEAAVQEWRPAAQSWLLMEPLAPGAR